MNSKQDKIGILVGSNCDKIWKEHVDTYCLSNGEDTNVKQDEASDDEDDDIFEELLESKRDVFESRKQDVKFPSIMGNSLESIIKSEIAEERNLNSLILKTEEIDIKTEGDTYVLTSNSIPMIKPEINKSLKCKIKNKEDQSDYQSSNYETIKEKAINSTKKRKKNRPRQNKKITYKCDNCSFQSRHKRSLNVHSLRHKDPSEVKMHKCLHCQYQSIQKHRLEVHYFRRHLPCDKGEMPKGYFRPTLNLTSQDKCPKCDYRTIDKSNLRRHIFRHDKTKSQQYTCDKCGVTTSTKYALKCHILRHNTPKTKPKTIKFTQYNPFPEQKCRYCDYKTKFKQNLLIHQREHENSKKIKMYACENCDYTTIYKSSFNRHTVTHTQGENIGLLKCNKCSFEAPFKRSLKRHNQLLHKSCEEFDIHKCSECDYETIYKGNLKTHAKRHHASEVEIYQCYECNHKTTRKDELKNHIFRHEKFKMVTR